MRVMLGLVPLLLAGAVFAQVNPVKRGVALDAPAPDITLDTLEGKGTSLAAIRAANTGKVIVLQFGSLTDPIFRNHATSVDRLAARDLEKAVFVIVYQKEFHAADSEEALEINASEGFNLADPTSQGERVKLAKMAVERLELKNQMMVVDGWNNAASLRYGSYPNMTFIVDAKGNVAAGYPFMDPARVQAAIDTLAAGKTLPDNLRGSVKPSAPAAFDASVASMEMTGGRGPAAIAAVLDHAEIPDAQRAALLGAVSRYLADVQNFRQARLGGPNAAVRPAAAGAARGPAPAPPAAPATPQDMQKAIADLRASAEKVKPVIKQTLNAKDAALLFAALDNLTPAQRLFGQ